MIAQPIAERRHRISTKAVLGVQHAEIVHGLGMARNRFNRPFEPVAGFLELVGLSADYPVVL